MTLEDKNEGFIQPFPNKYLSPHEQAMLQSRHHPDKNELLAQTDYFISEMRRDYIRGQMALMQAANNNPGESYHVTAE